MALKGNEAHRLICVHLPDQNIKGLKMFGDYQVFVKLFMAPKTVININEIMNFRMPKCLSFLSLMFFCQCILVM